MLKRVLILLVGCLLLSACQSGGSSSTTAVIPTAAGGIPPASQTAASSVTATLASSVTAALPPSPTVEPALGVIREVIASVEAHARPAPDWAAALAEMQLFAGGEVWAKAESTALVDLVMDGLVRVAPNTLLSVAQPDANTLQLNLDEGQIWVNIDGVKSGETFQVETPTAVISVRGTRFSVRVAADGATYVDCPSGSVEVTSKISGQTTTIIGEKQIEDHVTQNAVTVVRPDGSNTPAEIPTPDFYVPWSMAVGPDMAIWQPVGRLVFSYTLPYPVVNVQWSSDRQTLGIGYRNPQLEALDQVYRNFFFNYNLATGVIYTPTGFTTTTYNVVFSPAAAQMAWRQYGLPGDPQICSAALDGSSPACFAVDGALRQGNLVWSPDGQWLLMALGDTTYNGADTLYRFRPDGRDWQALTDIAQGRISKYAWSPDGSYIAYALQVSEEWDSPQQVWLMQADGSKARLAQDNAPWNVSFPWSPDGRLTLGLPQGLALMAASGLTETLVSQPGLYTGIRWSASPSGWPLYYEIRQPDEPRKLMGVRGPGQAPQLASFSRLTFSADRLQALIVDAIEQGEQVSSSTIYIFEIPALWP